MTMSQTFRLATVCALLMIAAGVARAQVIYLGPLSGPPIDPSQCKPSPEGQSGLCGASDGVHMSIAGQPFGGALCDSTSPNCKGPQGDSITISIGQTITLAPGSSATVNTSGSQGTKVVLNFGIPAGAPGATGPAGIVVGDILSGTATGAGSMFCQPVANASVPKGFTCNFSNLQLSNLQLVVTAITAPAFTPAHP
jgi:hypothetical protein